MTFSAIHSLWCFGMKFFCSFVLIMLIIVAPVFAQTYVSLDAVVYPPGSILSFSVYANEIELPEQLNCRLESAATMVMVTAVKGDTTAGRGKSYRLSLPSGIDGPITLSIEGVDASPVMFLISIPDGEFGTSSGNLEEYPTLSTLFNLAQPYITNIAPYEPIYFLAGTNLTKSKFQYSFKYRLLNPEGSLSESMPWLQGLHLAFTQTSFWDLQSESTPFQDTSYKPELFVLSPNSGLRPNIMDGLFFQLGYKHESNGRSGLESRSTNSLYLQSIMVFYDEESRFGLGLSPKIWVYVANDNETNPDLSNYRGYFDIELRLGKADSLIFGSIVSWAKEGGAIQADLTYPVGQFLGDNLAIYLQLQYVNALGESLITYQDRTEAFRIGFSVVR